MLLANSPSGETFRISTSWPALGAGREQPPPLLGGQNPGSGAVHDPAFGVRIASSATLLPGAGGGGGRSPSTSSSISGIVPLHAATPGGAAVGLDAEAQTDCSALASVDVEVQAGGVAGTDDGDAHVSCGVQCTRLLPPADDYDGARGVTVPLMPSELEAATGTPTALTDGAAVATDVASDTERQDLERTMALVRQQADLLVALKRVCAKEALTLLGGDVADAETEVAATATTETPGESMNAATAPGATPPTATAPAADRADGAGGGSTAALRRSLGEGPSATAGAPPPPQVAATAAPSRSRSRSPSADAGPALALPMPWHEEPTVARPKRVAASPPPPAAAERHAVPMSSAAAAPTPAAIGAMPGAPVSVGIIGASPRGDTEAKRTALAQLEAVAAEEARLEAQILALSRHAQPLRLAGVSPSGHLPTQRQPPLPPPPLPRSLVAVSATTPPPRPATAAAAAGSPPSGGSSHRRAAWTRPAW